MDLNKMNLQMRSNNGRLQCVITRDTEHNCPKVLLLGRNLNKLKDKIYTNFGRRILFYTAENLKELEAEVSKAGIDLESTSAIQFLENDQIVISKGE